MNRNDIDDIKMRKLLENKLPQAPHNEWFIKKTMNRLPEKRHNSISIIEIIGYLIAILSIISIETHIIYNVTTTGTLTLNDIVWLVSLNIGLIAIVFTIFAPKFRNYFSY